VAGRGVERQDEEQLPVPLPEHPRTRERAVPPWGAEDAVHVRLGDPEAAQEFPWERSPQGRWADSRQAISYASPVGAAQHRVVPLPPICFEPLLPRPYLLLAGATAPPVWQDESLVISVSSPELRTQHEHRTQVPVPDQRAAWWVPEQRLALPQPLREIFPGAAREWPAGQEAGAEARLRSGAPPA